MERKDIDRIRSAIENARKSASSETPEEHAAALSEVLRLVRAKRAVIEVELPGDLGFVQRHLVDEGEHEALCGQKVSKHAKAVRVSWDRAKDRCDECVEAGR